MAFAKSNRFKIALKNGRLRVRTLSLDVPEGFSVRHAEVRVHGKILKTEVEQTGYRVKLKLKKEAIVRANQDIELRLG